MLYFPSAGENNLLMLVAIIAIVSVLRPKHLNEQHLLPGCIIIEPANQQPEEKLGQHKINCTYSSHSVGISHAIPAKLNVVQFVVLRWLTEKVNYFIYM